MGRYLISVALCAMIVFVVAEIAELCLCANSSIILSPPCIEQERQALVDFKASLHDPSHYWLSSWQGVYCCQWEGVGCDNVTGHVVKLDLSTPYETCLLRPQPSGETQDCDKLVLQYVTAANVNPSLLQLEYLTYLDLTGNHFNSSPIPMFIGSMQRLTHLSLYRAGFGGRIPRNLRNLTNLHFLDLSWNWDLEASDVNCISGLRSLEHLDMSGVYIGKAHNSFQVLNTLPSLSRIYLDQCGLDMLLVPLVNLTNAPKLQVLSLAGNGLITLSNVDALQNMTSLVHLDLSHNNLTSVPLWFRNFEKLEYLDLSSCWLHGLIPDAIQNMAFIEFLDLSRNYFTSVPSWFAELKTLLFLDLSSNELKSMESSLSLLLSNMCHLKVLDFSDNNLREEALFGHHELSTCIKLEELYLSNNKLKGPLPSNLEQLVSLTCLELSHNYFTGTIPKSLCQLVNLQQLSLSNNHFNGTIPQNLSQLVNLYILDLSYNYFTGPIPESVCQLVNLRQLYLSKNYFNGIIPQNLSQLANLTFLDLSSNKLHGSLPVDKVVL